MNGYLYIGNEITINQLYDESYDKKEYKSNKFYPNRIYHDEV